MKMWARSLLALVFIGTCSYGFSNQLVYDEDKIYISSHSLFIDQDRLFVNFDGQFVEFDSVSTDHYGLYVRKSGINEREKNWTCKNGHLITDGSQVCPGCGDVGRN